MIAQLLTLFIFLSCLSIQCAQAGNQAFLFGYIDTQGTLVIKPQYEWAGPFHGGIAQVRKPGSTIKFIEKSGNQIEQFSQDRKQNLYPDVDRNGHWGYVDVKGRERLAHQFKYAGQFVEGLAFVQSDDQKFGYIDEGGKFLIPPVFELSNLSPVSLQAPKHEFHDGLALAMLVKNDQGKRIERYGFIDRSGNWVIKPVYTRAEPFSEGFAQVSTVENSTACEFFIDRAGKSQHEIWGYTRPFKDGLAFVRSGNSMNSGYIDKTGNFVIKMGSDILLAQEFSDGLAPVWLESGWTFIDKTGNFLSKERYDSVRSFSEGLAPVEQNHKWGFLNKSGAFVIKPEFNDAESFSDGLANVSLSTTTR